MNLIPNIVATITLITISYGCMQYIPVKFSNSQPMLRKISVQKRESKSITNVEDQITKTKALQQKGFEKNNLNAKNGNKPCQENRNRRCI